MNIKSILICLVCTFTFSAKCISCPKDSDLDDILKLGNIYIGEIHGTKEAPEFYKCLITRAIETTNNRVIVSLELEAEGISLTSEFWQRKEQVADGRSSIAMLEFVYFILERANLAEINLNLMYRNRASKYTPEIYGQELNLLSKKGLVIAISGNAHAAKEKFSFLSDSYLPEGKFVDPSFTHISLESISGGTFWGCMETCGIQRLPAHIGKVENNLEPSKEPYYDYTFYLEKFTASPPASSNAN